MDQSYSESDISISPTQVLERLQILRQLKLMQRGKLQKQCLKYQESAENSSITEIISHFTSSTSYNTFRSLLQSPHGLLTEDSSPNDMRKKCEGSDFFDGVSVLNLSQESECVVNSPVSSKSSTVVPSVDENAKHRELGRNEGSKSTINISLDDMPILLPKKDIETLIDEQLQCDKHELKETNLSVKNVSAVVSKRPYLKRGEGMARIGFHKKKLVIQNTKSLPWRSNATKANNLKIVKEPIVIQSKTKTFKAIKNLPREGYVKQTVQHMQTETPKVYNTQENVGQDSNVTLDNSTIKFNNKNPTGINTVITEGKYPMPINKGKTWATVLSKEQNDFLHQLKQSDYYKNFASPTKSTITDESCDDNSLKSRQEKEIVEQNMFDLLEKKVSSDSFHLENSFFNRFLRKNNDCSGESTPLMMQKCIINNPNLLHILPIFKNKEIIDQVQGEVEACASDYTECCSDTCSSISCCCSCKTVTQDINSPHHQNKEKSNNYNNLKRVCNADIKTHSATEKRLSQDNVIVDDNQVMNANMVEMNAKLITTSELLKERLCELEDEIETFRRENANLLKLREEVDIDKQKFYEEKSAYEQKLNEEKILAEYYLSEEKEKLAKQKQTYERYIREVKGRLSKKDRDEVICLKKEIETLKEDIKIKDAKSTSTAARLRNQIKIMEKEKKDFLVEVEKLKKENRRIQHSNDITRRLTNMKYLAEINKKLTKMTSNDNKSEINLESDNKYKSFEIERQSRSKILLPAAKKTIRPRAKSVPNINIASRYAKYFSQKDSSSQIDDKKKEHFIYEDQCTSDIEAYDFEDANKINSINDQEHENIISDSEDNLEKLYTETFRSSSSKTSVSSTNSYTNQKDRINKSDEFFLHQEDPKSSAKRVAKSPPTPIQRTSGSTSPVFISTQRTGNKSPLNTNSSFAFETNISGGSNNSINRAMSPLSCSNHSTQNQRPNINLNSQHIQSLTRSCEPSASKISLTRTNLNPTEIKKPDGSKELRFPNGNVKHISADGKYSKFMYYNGDIKENFYNEGRIKYFYSETKTFHTTHADGLEVLEFSDGQVEKRYKDGSTEIRLPNGSIRYFDPKNKHVREEWRFPDGTALTISANGEQRVVFGNGQIEVHTDDHKRREFPDGTVKLVYKDGTSETRYASGRVRIKNKHGNLIMDSAPR